MNTTSLSRRHQLILICFFVLGVFYPSIFGEILSLDDSQLVRGLLNSSNFSLWDALFPQSSGGMYYRPLPFVTFWFDKILWGLEESFMHLENVLIHLLNALLVYWLAAQVWGNENSRAPSRYVPFVASLAFALHPVNTEAVNWISGRFDLTATVFVLLSANLLLYASGEGKRIYLGLSLVAFVLGLLCKEVAFGLLPGAVFLWLAARSREETPILKRVFQLILGITAFGAAGSIFYLMRKAAFASSSSKVGLTLKFIVSDPGHAVLVFLRTFGFYMKKLVVPYPLNFAIIEVDPLYELLAMPIVALCLYLALRRDRISATFLAGVFLMTPSFPIAYNQIAWTPYAERYIYTASAFIIVAVVSFLNLALRAVRLRSPVVVATAAVLAVMTTTTCMRNIIWQSNYTLFKDTVEKTPNFNRIRNEYGIALMEKTRFADARQQFELATSLSHYEYPENPKLNLLTLPQDVKKGKVSSTAIQGLEMMVDEGKGSAKILQRLIQVTEHKILDSKDPIEKKMLTNKLYKHYQKLYEKTGSPHALYRLGQYYFVAGDTKNAKKYFSKSHELFPPDSEYKGFAEKMLKRL